MAEKGNFKKISRRFLSSFRKGKKLQQIKEHGDEIQHDKERLHDLETTFCLEEQSDKDHVFNRPLPPLPLGKSDDKNVQINSTKPKSQALNQRSSFSNLRSVRQDHPQLNFASPRVRRGELGGLMSASTDSGIDCSLLMSDKGSPEQFVAFSRREAERLRHEHILKSQNESVLETLTEVDSRSSSEDIVGENVLLNEAIQQNVGVAVTEAGASNEDVLQQEIDKAKKHVDLLSELKTALSEKLTICETSNPPSSTSEEVGVSTNEQIRANASTSVEPSHSNRQTDVNLNNPETLDNYFLNMYANKTDEAKTEEARIRSESSAIQSHSHNNQSFSLESPHEIVNPIPIMSTSVANNRTLESTPSPARLYINENSAFAKCKSIKRSVSDVGKEILGKLRHKRKTMDSSIVSKDDSYAGDIKFKDETRRFVKSKSKKLSMSKKNKSTENGHSNDQPLPMNKTNSTKESKSASNNASMNVKKGKKSPVHKEFLTKSSHPSGLYFPTFHEIPANVQSPVLKENTSQNQRSEKETKLGRVSPEVNNSIFDLTNSICEMTSALQQTQSVESIACICDCKNKRSDQDCCDKRKTPSPFNRQVDAILDSTISGADVIEICPDDIEITEYPDDVDDDDFNLNQFNQSLLPMTETESQTNSKKNQFERLAVNKLDMSNMSKLFDQDFDTEDSDTNTCSDCDQDHSCGEDCDCSDVECSDEECTECCRQTQRKRERKMSSSSASSEESEDINDKIVKSLFFSEADSTHCDINESINKTISEKDFVSPSITPEKVEQPSNQTESFDVAQSPYSVSFRELNFANGDVMYIDNSFCDNYFNNTRNESLCSPALYSLGITPTASPMNSSVDTSPTPLNLSENSSFCNVSPMNGGLPDTPDSCFSPAPLDLSRNISVKNCSDSPSPLDLSQSSRFVESNPYRRKNSSKDNLRLEGSFIDVNNSENNTNQNRKQVYTKNVINFSESELNQSNISRSRLNRSVSQTVNSPRQYGQLGSRYSRSSSNVRSLNESLNLPKSNSSRLNRSLNQSILSKSLNESLNQSYSSSSRSQNTCRPVIKEGLTLSQSALHAHNASFNRSLNQSGLLNASLQEMTTATPPLDLSMSKQKHDRWVERHLGQVYSPAKRVLHKNRGLSENDLCRQILDLYVSDVDESMFEPDQSLNMTMSPPRSGGTLVNDSILQYGTYVAPRHEVRETNVDDFSTKTVRKCYEGEARTRKLQAGSRSTVSQPRSGKQRQASMDDSLGTNSLNTTLDSNLDTTIYTEIQDTSQTSQTSPRVSKTKSRSKSRHVTYEEIQPRVQGRAALREGVQGRAALRDRTNTTRRLATLQMPPSFDKDMKPELIREELRKENTGTIPMNERSFDRLTLLHTGLNGTRKVRCLSMNESQSIIKHYPPPREATRISWGQDLSEMDLYRHTPNKKPVKTKPILTQTENNFPYDEDTPSPIVLTKMRKPKSLSKRYKNWPWSS